MAAVAEQLSDVQIVVNNAGIGTSSTPLTANLERARAELEVNYLGLMSMTQAFAPVLAANGGGAFVNMLSVVSWIGLQPNDQGQSGRRPERDLPGHRGAVQRGGGALSRAAPGRAHRGVRAPRRSQLGAPIGRLCRWSAAGRSPEPYHGAKRDNARPRRRSECR